MLMHAVEFLCRLCMSKTLNSEGQEKPHHDKGFGFRVFGGLYCGLFISGTYPKLYPVLNF